MSGRLCWNVWKWEEKSFLKLAKFNHFSNIFFFFLSFCFCCCCSVCYLLPLDCRCMSSVDTLSSAAEGYGGGLQLLYLIFSLTLLMYSVLSWPYTCESREGAHAKMLHNLNCVFGRTNRNKDYKTVLEKITTSSIKHSYNWFTNYSKTFNKSVSKQRDQLDLNSIWNS